jgi:Tfp pilus assembly protein PilV
VQLDSCDHAKPTGRPRLVSEHRNESRKRRLNAQLFQPGALVGPRARQAQPDRRRRGIPALPPAQRHTGSPHRSQPSHTGGPPVADAARRPRSRRPACGPSAPAPTAPSLLAARHLASVAATRARVAFTGSSCAIRRKTVPRDGTTRPRTRHNRVISRQTAATERRCRVRYRARRTSPTITSTSAGNRLPPRPPLDRPGNRSDTTPSPARHRSSSRYTLASRNAELVGRLVHCGNAYRVQRRQAADQAACRTATSHSSSDAVNTPRSDTSSWPKAESPTPRSLPTSGPLVQATAGHREPAVGARIVVNHAVGGCTDDHNAAARRGPQASIRCTDRRRKSFQREGGLAPLRYWARRRRRELRSGCV